SKPIVEPGRRFQPSSTAPLHAAVAVSRFKKMARSSPSLRFHQGPLSRWTMNDIGPMPAYGHEPKFCELVVAECLCPFQLRCEADGAGGAAGFLENFFTR